MKLESKEVKIGDEKYTVKEISMGDMLPIMPRLQGSAEEQQNAQFDMMKKCIFLDNKAVGDALMQLGVRAYMQLTHAVLEVNGLDGVEGGKG